MSTYALINPEGELDRLSRDIDPSTGTREGWRWLPVEDERPGYDDSLQVLSGPVVTVHEDRVTRVWSVTDKTVAERLAGSSITMRQLRRGLLLLAGKPASYVLDTINTIEDPVPRDEALIWYEETDVVHWDHPMTQALIAQTEFTIEQAGALWLQSMALEG